jgi:DHA1 family tetracycline resistance protein-like MFS transporter
MRLLLACIFIELLGFGIIIPLLPFMALKLGAGPQEVTLLVATHSLAVLLTAPLWGRLSDRWGRKPVLLIAFLGAAGAFLILAFADTLWMLFAARALAGALSGDLVGGPAYISDVSPPERRAKSMGLLGAAFALSFTIGPGLGAALAGGDPATADFRTPALLSTGLAVAAFVLGLVLLPESRRPGSAPKAAGGRSLRRIVAELHYPNLPLITAILFLIGIVFVSMESTIALWSADALDWGPRQVGYLFTFAGIVAIIFQGGLIGPLSRRFGEARLVVGAAVLLGLGMALVPLSQGLPLLLVAIACLAAGFGLGNPSLHSLISRLSHADRTGGALGLGQAANSLARVVAPPCAGFLFETLGRGAPYVAGAAVMLLVLALAEGLRRRVGLHPAVETSR